MRRSSGILMHISSLPSRYGIGTLGEKAYEFADFLKSAGQKYWQMLPLGHTGYGDSPYQVFSMYAGNPYFIDIDFLIRDGLLDKAAVTKVDWGRNARAVDYGAIYQNRYPLLRKAFEIGRRRLAKEIAAFRMEHSRWLEDYALFMALKAHFGMRSWMDWEDSSIRTREERACSKYRRELAEDIEFYVFLQYLFFSQWSRLRGYVSSLGIKLIGDLPIYVAPDSADVWSRPECFLLDENRRPRFVAGVPPDYFSRTGQLWGNPIYDWNALGADGYALWIDRLTMAASQFDTIRIDHFRGIESYYAIPYGEKTAANGQWRRGPGMDLVRVLKERFAQTEIIAEDLGDSTESLRAFVMESGYPGMKVLQFAFDSREKSDYMPHTYSDFCVCYTGTHDNTTAAGWFRGLSAEDRRVAAAYLGLSKKEGPAWGLIRGGMASVAGLFIAQMQDYLELPDSCRMNTPATVGRNWRWRMLERERSPELAERIRRMTLLFGR